MEDKQENESELRLGKRQRMKGVIREAEEVRSQDHGQMRDW
jgi:hypothetical protein